MGRGWPASPVRGGKGVFLRPPKVPGGIRHGKQTPPPLSFPRRRAHSEKCLTVYQRNPHLGPQQAGRPTLPTLSIGPVTLRLQMGRGSAQQLRPAPNIWPPLTTGSGGYRGPWEDPWSVRLRCFSPVSKGLRRLGGRASTDRPDPLDTPCHACAPRASPGPGRQLF